MLRIPENLTYYSTQDFNTAEKGFLKATLENWFY